MGRPCNALLSRSHDVSTRFCGDVPLRRRWVFHFRRTHDVTGTCRETPLRRRYDVATTSRWRVGNIFKILIVTNIIFFQQICFININPIRNNNPTVF